MPLVAPGIDGAMNGCVCVSWWKTTDQSNVLAASVPSSGSVAGPRVGDDLPAAVERAGGRLSIFAVGAWFAVTVSTASALVALPDVGDVTLKLAPLSAWAAAAIV